MSLTISVYGSHNASVAMEYNGKYYVVEVERWLNLKNSGLLYYNGVRDAQIVFDEISNWLLSHTKGECVDVFLTGYADAIVPKFNYRIKQGYDHHTSHAACAFYQSPYDSMLVFTFDGGGDGAFFNVYDATKSDGLKLIASYNQDLGFPYMCLAEVLADITREHLSIGNLVYAGKLMGLCAYGTVNESWLPAFMKFYDTFKYSGESYIGGGEAMKDAMTTLFASIGLDYVHGTTRYSDATAYDIAATSQKAFEATFFNIVRPHLQSNRGRSIGMSGGCALNVLLNTELVNRGLDVFVPPNTNDCGMAVGGILWFLKPEAQVDLTYSGLPIMDSKLLMQYVYSHNFKIYDNIHAEQLAGFIKDGNIIAVVQGNAEHGSRALGNRSIICAAGGDMKDIINKRVKRREWYRPFAPVVRLEDVSKYFTFENSSRHMTYAAPIKDEWQETLKAVTHVDGTGRLQTVTSTENQFLYDLLTEYDKLTGVGVLLNTSLNVNGRPIASTLADIFKLLAESDMDAVWYENKLITKNNSSIIGDRNG